MAADLGWEALALARLWIATPYVHQASQRGFGTDCLGLVRGIWRELYGGEPGPVPAYTPDWGEAGGGEILRQAAEHWFVPKRLDGAAPGDLLLFQMRRGAPAKHLGIQGETAPEASFVHGYSGHAVVESPLSTPWARRIIGRYGWPARG